MINDIDMVARSRLDGSQETYDAGMGEDSALRCNDFARVRMALTSLVPHPDAAQKRLVAMPWMFDPEVREHLASGCLVLHRLGAEFTDVRAVGVAGQTVARLEASLAETALTQIIPIGIDSLRLDVNALQSLPAKHHFKPQPVFTRISHAFKI